jgi:hypothetical protein
MQGRALDRSARKPIIGENLAAPGTLQSRVLHGGVLIVGRYSGVAVFHYLIVGQTFGTRKPAFYAGFEIIPKLTLCETLRRAFRNASNVESQESCIHPMFSHTARARPVLRCSPLLSRHNLRRVVATNMNIDQAEAAGGAFYEDRG